MEWKALRNKIDVSYLILAVIGFASIAYFINIKTALFLIVFLAEAASTTYFLMNVYLFIINKRDTTFFKPIAVSSSSVLVTGCLLYFYYGTYALLRALSISIVLFVVILGYTWFTKKNS